MTIYVRALKPPSKRERYRENKRRGGNAITLVSLQKAMKTGNEIHKKQLNACCFSRFHLLFFQQRLSIRRKTLFDPFNGIQSKNNKRHISESPVKHDFSSCTLALFNRIARSISLKMLMQSNVVLCMYCDFYSANAATSTQNCTFDGKPINTILRQRSHLNKYKKKSRLQTSINFVVFDSCVLFSNLLGHYLIFSLSLSPFPSLGSVLLSPASNVYNSSPVSFYLIEMLLC